MPIKKIFFILVCGFFLSGCGLTMKKSGLEIESFPTATVYIDGKEVGSTPYENDNLNPGEKEIKLVTKSGSWNKKIELKNNIHTVVNWQFGETEDDASGYVLYLEKTGDSKKAGLVVKAVPEKSSITVASEIKGQAPKKIADIGDGDKQLILSFPGYKSMTIFIKAIKGYQLVVESKLAKEKITVDTTVPVETTQTSKLSTETTTNKKVTIKETETGWLKVREASSSASREITRVNPGEKYGLLEETTDWVKIDLGANKSGWISASYAAKDE